MKFLLALLFIVLSLNASGKTKIACIGNSITYGSMLKNPSEDSYPAQLEKMLDTSLYTVGNFGHPGATLLYKGHNPYMKTEQFKKALDYCADIAVIHLGINDTDPRNWPNYRDDFIEDYLALIDSLKKSNKNMRIIIARMTPIRDTHPRFNSGTRCWHEQIQKHIEIVSKISHSEIIDFENPLIVHPEFYSDHVHPSKQGAEIMAKVVYETVTGDYGGLKVSMLYSDNMVIQRQKPIVISGTANAGQEIKVTLGKNQAKVVTGKDGKWNVTFPEMKATVRPLSLCITDGKTKLEYKNISIGEVWLCSGQSNMEFMLKQSSTSQDAKISEDSDLRFFDMKAYYRTDNVQWSKEACDSINQLKHFRPCTWTTCTPESSADFSAIAYYFGKMLRDSLKVPIGLICNAVGGSTQESWIDRKTLENEIPGILLDWTKNDFIQQWCRERALKNMKNSSSQWVHHPYEPCYLFDTGIRPLGKPEIKGVIWYQGESNAHCCETYRTLFILFTNSWRKWFERPDLPIYYVQLSSLERPSWCWFRNTQRELLDTIKNTGMAITSDLGDRNDVHPKEKKQVGERLAKLALYNSYGFKDIIPTGPLFKNAYRDGYKVIIDFSYSYNLHAKDSEDIRGFEIAGKDMVYHSAKCSIAKEEIVLESDSVKEIFYVRYGWRPYTDANLVNGASLPTSTFTVQIF